jgi:pimeloyl-ACP methyl ester carboxylesterase
MGVGHSMGGAALLMAAQRSPQQFERLVLFEPIAHDAPVDPVDMEALPIVQGARRRRRRFGSFDEAYGNFEDKPPLSLMTPEVLRLYIEHGFRIVDDGIDLLCSPETEADIFVNARQNGVWDLLPEVAIPVTVVAGVIDETQPSQWAQAIAERLPKGRYIHLPHQTHFGPFSHPEEFAALVLADI